MKERIFCNWGLLRFVRLFIGTIVAVQGVFQKDGLITFAGIILMLSAVLNYGCCGSSGCAVSYSKEPTNKETEYEEVDASK
jgi:hypothetical protein